MEQKVLIITYYWPPSGGSGVQRWLKFVKYLPQFGWTPYVFTPENPSFAVRDESLLRNVPPEAEIIHFPIWEPYAAFNKISSAIEGERSLTPTGLVAGKKKTLFQKMSTWVRGNLIIPDPRVFWVRPSVKYLDGFIKRNNIRRIITTGPPHSIHLIGLGLKKRNKELKWFADFRDPWSEWGFLDSLMVGKIARGFHRRLESKVLRAADDIITITPFYARQFERLSSRKVSLLTNGFDEEDFSTLTLRSTDKFVVRHVGTVNEKCDPRPFMKALEHLANENESFRNHVAVDFVGEVHPDFVAFVKGSQLQNSVTTFTPAVPHRRLVELYECSSLLLLVLTGYKDAEGYMPGKLFEYLATGLPIIGTGPEDGDAAALFNKAGVGDMIDGTNERRIKEILLKHFEAWKLAPQHQGKSVGSNYSRRAITGQLAELLQ